MYSFLSKFKFRENDENIKIITKNDKSFKRVVNKFSFSFRFKENRNYLNSLLLLISSFL